MTKHRPSPSKAGRRQQQLEKLLEAIAIGDSADHLDHFDRYATTRNLEEIEHYYARQVAVSSQPDRKLVRRYRDTIIKLLSLSDKIGPEFFAGEIEKAGWSRRNPHADEMTLHMLMEEHSDKRDNVVTVLTERRLDIDHWLKTSGDTYRKRVVTKLAVEPFLQLLIERGAISSSKKLPRLQVTQMVEALFDWLGVEQAFRLTPVAIATIARRLASANPR
ncbi:hypothetical protein SAMN05216338_105536 [Bradyrhizobium sp. Rc2d]|uniref:hypothetical protein n=1 Tax=Bradyrhizobium sp. Rc2d TaxID=1855321 RepID=UPI000888A6DB|nr:hypothetical protein [Bradyrhizobium sp. Rc2d]SDJ58491.1 hypothetical protein SAMN05216338_105536 [Bradyrhizobium sp. Rc2d]